MHVHMCSCAHVLMCSHMFQQVLSIYHTLFYLPICINDLTHCNSFCFDIGVLEIFE